MGLTPYYRDDFATIYHGDCRDILPALPTVGMVLVTDPPYGITHSSNKAGAPLRGEQIANDGTTDVRDAVLSSWEGPALVFGTCRVPPPPIPLRAILTWDKGGHVGMGDLALPWKQNWEHIYVSGPGFSGRRGPGVLRYNAIAPWSGKQVHPHEKPVELLRDLIGKCPPLCDVLDPFMGCGSTLRAAKDHGRRAIGIEVDEGYCEIAAKRLGQEVMDFGGVA